MENGIHLEVIWFDQDVIEIVLSCSNERFSGQAEIYLSHADLLELANGLRDFLRASATLVTSSLAHSIRVTPTGNPDEAHLSEFHGTRCC